jgi:hypothetical protein
LEKALARVGKEEQETPALELRDMHPLVSAQTVLLPWAGGYDNVAKRDGGEREDRAPGQAPMPQRDLKDSCSDSSVGSDKQQ